MSIKEPNSKKRKFDVTEDDESFRYLQFGHVIALRVMSKTANVNMSGAVLIGILEMLYFALKRIRPENTEEQIRYHLITWLNQTLHMADKKNLTALYEAASLLTFDESFNVTKISEK
jgi:hypothetical protein